MLHALKHDRSGRDLWGMIDHLEVMQGRLKQIETAGYGLPMNNTGAKKGFVSKWATER